MSFFGNLDPEAYDRQYTDAALVQRVARYFGGQRRHWFIIAGALLVVAVLDIFLPLAVSQAINALSPARLAERSVNVFPLDQWVDQTSTTYVLLIAGGVLLAGVLSWGANYLRRRLTSQAVGDVVFAMRRDAFRATVAHDLSFYDEFSSGRIVSRITSDTQEFAQVVTLITDTFSQIITVLILALILFSIDWPLALALIITSPAVLLVASGFRQLARRATRQGNRAMANVNASIQESIAGIAVAKNFRQEREIYNTFREVNRQSYTINLRRGFVLANVFPVLNMVAGAAIALIAYLGGRSAMAGVIAGGTWYLFVQSVDRFFFPFINLASFWSQMQAGLSATERVFALIDAEPVVRQTADEAAPLQGAIHFENLSFRYSAKEPVLNGFTLQVRPGETVALVGHTGAGKSSIAKLIARFYEFQAGQLRVDGRDIRAFDLRHYRQQLGIVSQAPFLFTGTVADNIRYARPKMTDAEIEALARQIGNGEWLDTLPEGLQTNVGERGARLSMGQRQLVALMRVLVQKPAIFILDEATASVDPFTEEQIQEALDLILKHSTAIIIAHRLSTVKNADRIIVLKKGQIIEEGSHARLLEQGGHYAELYNTYFRHQSLEAINAFGKYRGEGASHL
jgi:ATP-binding cassette subfamily B protein